MSNLITKNFSILQEWQKEDKLSKLLAEMASDASSKILVFTETKRKCDDLTRSMRRNGYPAMCIHGDKKQEERDWVLGEFRTGRTLILVATDVAARGLGRNSFATKVVKFNKYLSPELQKSK